MLSCPLVPGMVTLRPRHVPAFRAARDDAGAATEKPDAMSTTAAEAPAAVISEYLILRIKPSTCVHPSRGKVPAQSRGLRGFATRRLGGLRLGRADRGVARAIGGARPVGGRAVRAHRVGGDLEALCELALELGDLHPRDD